MPKRVKPHSAPATRTVVAAQPTPSDPVRKALKPVIPSVTRAANTHAEDTGKAGSQAPAKSATAAGQSASTPTEPAALPSSPEPAAFQPKVYAPGDIACPHQNADLINCGAQAGEPCNWQQPGMQGTYHAERVAEAAAASQRDGIKSTREQFDQAVWDSGLF